MEPDDLPLLREAIALARSARERGNRPFGALVVAGDGRVLGSAENTQRTTGECTGHAELNLIRELCPRHSPGELATATLYASGEPCAMCAGAIYWSGIGRVLFGMSTHSLLELAGEQADALQLSCREVLARGTRVVQVEGPALEEEVREVVEGFL